jgi:hypothetical protein
LNQLASRSARVFGTVQFARRNRDARPANAEHHGEEFVSYRKAIALGPVMRHEDPTPKTLVERMAAIAGGRLRDLQVECVGKAQNAVAQAL